MTYRLTYLVGGPASGKTTLTSQIFAGFDSHAVVSRNLIWVTRHRLDDLEVTELGRPRDRFGGTDALPMSVMPLALQWISTRPARYVFGEGDRLASDKFILAAQHAGYDTAVIYLDTPPDILEARRQHRDQNPAWVQGRDTKSQRFAERWNATRLNGAQSPLANARQALDIILGTVNAPS